MARRSGYTRVLAQGLRYAQQQQRAQIQAATQAAHAAERARNSYERAQRADTAERARLYTETRSADVALLNEQLSAKITQLETILHETLGVDDYLDLATLKSTPPLPVFDSTAHAPERAPELQPYLPEELRGVRKFLPGVARAHAQQIADAKARYDADLAVYTVRERARQRDLAETRAAHDRYVAQLQAETAAQHEQLDTLQRAVLLGEPEAITHYVTLVLDASVYPADFPRRFKVALVPESRQLVLEYDLPPFTVVPEARAFKYVKGQDEVTTMPRLPTQRKALYASLVAQIALRTLHEIYEADRPGHVESIVFNGYVDSIDPGTGRPARTCVITVRATRDLFTSLDLSQVDPIACLKTLSASISKSPAELAPVRPVLEFSMVDPRFIEQTDVLSDLDQRPNLMDLTPNEFETLIANLFQKMGLETRLTQASRDGGVDCVAFDQRPILGGKVVIQAKRYKHTVGVSAVRDLYGTVQNEGASKGILVTTSGYGKAAFDFAKGKPLELLSGSNLLALLAEHAGTEAKIEMPAQWKDPQPDVGGDDGDATA